MTGTWDAKVLQTISPGNISKGALAAAAMPAGRRGGYDIFFTIIGSLIGDMMNIKMATMELGRLCPFCCVFTMCKTLLYDCRQVHPMT